MIIHVRNSKIFTRFQVNVFKKLLFFILWWNNFILLCSGNLLEENVWEWIVLVSWGEQHVLLFLIEDHFLTSWTGRPEKLIIIMQTLDFARLILLIPSGKSHVGSPWILVFFLQWDLFLNGVSIFPCGVVSFVLEIVRMMIGWMILFVLKGFLLVLVFQEVKEVFLLGWSEDVPVFGLVVFGAGVGWVHWGRLIWFVLNS